MSDDGRNRRKRLVAGNWKLHNTVAESVGLARDLAERLSWGRECEVAVAPVFTALRAVSDALAGSRIYVAAQDCYWEDRGAFTGEVSPPLLLDAGCAYCIVGHSERRHLLGESDEAVNKKTRALLGHGLRPIVCVGETLAERERKKTLDVVLGQLTLALSSVEPGRVSDVVVAYEPVWAIGTGRTASPSDAQEVHAAIRGRLGELFDASRAKTVRVLYGGSVKPGNAKDLLAQPDIDGALVGGASLELESFVPIVEAAG